MQCLDALRRILENCIIFVNASHMGTQVLIRYLSSISFCQKPLNTRLFGAFKHEINCIVTEISFIVSKNRFSVQNSPFLFGWKNSYLCDTICSIKKNLLNAHQHFLNKLLTLTLRHSVCSVLRGDKI